MLRTSYMATHEPWHLDKIVELVWSYRKRIGSNSIVLPDTLARLDRDSFRGVTLLVRRLELSLISCQRIFAMFIVRCDFEASLIFLDKETERIKWTQLLLSLSKQKKT